MEATLEERQLLPEHCTVELDGYFSCEICLCVVNDPSECNECNQLVCEVCIKGWLKAHRNCPTCRKSYAKRKLNRFVKQDLDQFEFKCEKCTETFAYKDKQQHWLMCSLKTNCPFGYCKRKDFTNLEMLKQHWLTECLHIKVTCELCSEETTRRVAHNCDNNFKELIQKLRIENKKLRANTLSQPST